MFKTITTKLYLLLCTSVFLCDRGTTALQSAYTMYIGMTHSVSSNAWFATMSSVNFGVIT